MSAEVQVTPAPSCPVCGTNGVVLHEGARDWLFGAPGTWRYRRCPGCALVWQDPMVTPEDVGRLYQSYYTHARPADTGQSTARRLYRAAQRGHLANRYGYETARWSDRVLGALLALHPGRRADADFLAQYLPARARGRLLDVGCGHGAMLTQMRELGWQAEGIEFDDAAAAVARERGFRVALGTVFTADVPAGAFDAVTMSHVIEHVHDPIATLQRCRALLAPGGTLVAITPNAESWGHRTFGVAWRGLEPPRHLHVFSQRALAQAARAAGFTTVSVQVTIRNARGIFDLSHAIRAAIQRNDGPAVIPAPTVPAELWQAAEWCRTWVQPTAGEELVLVAQAR